MKKFTVTMEFTENFKNVREFNTKEEAMVFAKNANLTAKAIEVFEEVNPVAEARCFRRVARFRNGKWVR